MKRTLLFFALAACLLGGLFVGSRASADPVLGPGFYDDRIPAITYWADAGYSWTIYNDASYYLSTLTWTTPTPAAGKHYVYFSFWGEGVILYYIKASSGSSAVYVCIDVTNCTTISMYNASTQYWQSSELCCYGYGVHDVVIHANNNGQWGLDAVNVLPPQEQPTIPPVVVTVILPTLISVEVTVEALVEITQEPPDYEVTLEVEGQGGQPMAFQYKADAGQVAMVLLQAATLFVLVIISVIVVLKWILSR